MPVSNRVWVAFRMVGHALLLPGRHFWHCYVGMATVAQSISPPERRWAGFRLKAGTQLAQFAGTQSNGRVDQTHCAISASCEKLAQERVWLYPRRGGVSECAEVGEAMQDDSWPDRASAHSHYCEGYPITKREENLPKDVCPGQSRKEIANMEQGKEESG